MKRLLLLLCLVASIALAGKNSKKDDERSDRAQTTARVQGVFSVEATNWDTMAINTSDLHCAEIYVMGGGVMWINGYTSSDDVVLHSTDNGATWVTTTMAFTGFNEYVLAPRDGNTAIAAAGNGRIFRTTDGGTTWDSVYYYGGNYWDGIKFAGGDTVIAVGDAFDSTGLYVVMSTNAGVTWTRFTNLPTAEHDAGTVCSSAYCQCIDIIGHNVWIALYWSAGIAPQLLHSTDLGTTWTSTTLNLTGGAVNAYRVRSIDMVDENVGWLVPNQTASGTRCYVHKTTDGGATWSDTIKVDVKGNVVMAVKPMRGTNNLLAIGYLSLDARAWWSSDGGSTWTGVQPPVLGDGGDLFNAAFVSTSMGYVVGDYRALTFTVPTTSVGPVRGEVPSSYALHQNYPNPFNPTTTIGYAVPKASNVELKVYNVLGQEIATLVQGQHSAGEFTVVFDARNISSGVYFYTLRAENVVLTKSLVLMK